MDLEERVQALENEVEILKNQIQTTLLDIQTQLLTNAHPALRANQLPPPPSGESAGAPIKSFRPGAEAETAETNEAPNGAPVKVRQVAAEPPSAPPKPAAQQRTQPDEMNWTRLDDMEEWVSGKVTKLGPERTRQLVHMYLENGRFGADVARTLLRFVDLYAEDRERPFETLEVTRPSRPPNMKTMPAPKPSPAPSSNGQKSRASSQAATHARPPTSKAKPAPRPSAHPTEGEQGGEDHERRGTVLRLIAGLYNAGAGVQWSKKNDG